MRHLGLSCFWHHIYTCIVLSVDITDYCHYAFGEQGSLKYVKIFIVVFLHICDMCNTCICVFAKSMGENTVIDLGEFAEEVIYCCEWR